MSYPVNYPKQYKVQDGILVSYHIGRDKKEKDIRPFKVYINISYLDRRLDRLVDGDQISARDEDSILADCYSVVRIQEEPDGTKQYSISHGVSNGIPFDIKCFVNSWERTFAPRIKQKLIEKNKVLRQAENEARRDGEKSADYFVNIALKNRTVRRMLRRKTFRGIFSEALGGKYYMFPLTLTEQAMYFAYNEANERLRTMEPPTH